AGAPDDVRAVLPGPATVVVKDGAVGATAYGPGRAAFVAAPAVAVVEPVGAGDAFAAGYLFGSLRGLAEAGRLVAGHRMAAVAGARRGRRGAAGTVLTPAAAGAAAEAGAAFTVAPGLDLDVLSASLRAGLPHVPGVATPSEVHLAVRAGCRWLKAFPAASLGP